MKELCKILMVGAWLTTLCSYGALAAPVSPQPDQKTNKVTHALQQVLEDRPDSILDRAAAKRHRSSMTEFRRVVRNNPEEALQLLDHQKAYVPETVHEILASNQAGMIDGLRDLIFREDIELKIRRWIVGGIVPVRLKGKMREDAGALLLEVAKDTKVPLSLRTAAVLSLSADSGQFITDKKEVQEFLVRAFDRDALSKGDDPFQSSLFYAIGIGVSWERGGKIVLDVLEKEAPKGGELFDEIILSFWSRFCNIEADPESEKNRALLPNPEDGARLIDILSPLLATAEKNSALSWHSRGILAALAALASEQVSSKALDSLITLDDDEGLTSAISAGAMHNPRLLQSDILERALSCIEDRDADVRRRSSWLSVLELFVNNENLALELLIENRTALSKRLPPILKDEKLSERDKGRLKKLIALSQKDPSIEKGWKRVAAAKSRFQQLMDADSKSADDYARVALDALLDFQIDTFEQAMAKLMEVGPKTSIALRVKASIRMYLNHDLKEFKNNLNELIEVAPDFADAYGLRAYCHVRSGDLNKAFVDSEKAIELGSDNSITYTAWGMVLFGRYDFALAAEKFRKALKLRKKPDNPNAAPEDFIQANPTKYAWLGLGQALFVQGKYEEAAEHFRKYIEYSNYDNVDSFLWLYMSKLMAHDDATVARAAVSEWVKDTKHYARSTGATNNFLVLLLRASDENAIANFLDKRRKSSWSGDGMYLAGKLAQRAKLEEFSKYYFEKATGERKHYFFSAILALYELKKAEGKARPGE